MKHPFTPGQKVVCIDDRFPAAVYECYDAVPKQGRIYTVSECCQGRSYTTGRRGPSIRLTEIPPIIPGFGCFSAYRFRALLTTQQEKQERTKEALHA